MKIYENHVNQEFMIGYECRVDLSLENLIIVLKSVDLVAENLAPNNDTQSQNQVTF